MVSSAYLALVYLLSILQIFFYFGPVERFTARRAASWLQPIRAQQQFWPSDVYIDCGQFRTAAGMCLRSSLVTFRFLQSFPRPSIAQNVESTPLLSTTRIHNTLFLSSQVFTAQIRWLLWYNSGKHAPGISSPCHRRYPRYFFHAPRCLFHSFVLQIINLRLDEFE